MLEDIHGKKDDPSLDHKEIQGLLRLWNVESACAAAVALEDVPNGSVLNCRARLMHSTGPATKEQWPRKLPASCTVQDGALTAALCSSRSCNRQGGGVSLPPCNDRPLPYWGSYSQRSQMPPNCFFLFLHPWMLESVKQERIGCRCASSQRQTTANSERLSRF